MEHINGIPKYTNFVLAVELKNFYVANKIYNKDKHTLKWAIKVGYLNIVKYLIKINNSDYNLSPTPIDLACEYGHLHLVKWFHKNSYICTDYAMNHAAKNGHLNIVKWLHKHAHNDINAALGWSNLHNDNTKVIKFLTKLKIPIKNIDLISQYIEKLNYNYKYISSFTVNENTWQWAAISGDLELIKKLHISDKSNYTKLTMDLAAGNGHLEIVKYLHNNGYKGTILTMNLAVMDNQLEIVKYLIEIKELNIEEAVYLARYCGYFKILQFLHNNVNNSVSEFSIESFDSASKCIQKA